MHYERMSLKNEGNCWGAVTSKAPVLRRDGVQPLQPDCSPSHLHSAKACPVVRMLPCSGYHPRGYRCGGARSTCSGGQGDREVPPSRVSIRALITNLVPQRE